MPARKHVQYDFPEKADLVDCGGEEVYAIVPRAGMSVSVSSRGNAREMESTMTSWRHRFYEGKRGTDFFDAMSGEIFPDVLLIISDGRTMHLFRPMISRDGHLAEEGCYDFSVYEPPRMTG